ncbi:polysaccharide biosynthesis protein [Metabacillus idriensis]|uniref:polysaccharide biosynthesis protein n=1 Tax=Metabacillus idriensis TaxID=324768 RepID=UPI003D2E4EA5
MHKNKRYILLIFFDALLILASVLTSTILLYGINSEIDIANSVYISILFWISIIGVFHLFNYYDLMWKYVSVRELAVTAAGLVQSLLLVHIVHYLINAFMIKMTIHHSILLITWIIIMFALFISRFSYRLLKERKQNTKSKDKKVLIVGAGSAGALVVKELNYGNSTSLNPIAFLDDDPAKLNLLLMGLPVVGASKDLMTIVKKLDIDLVIIAIPSAPRTQISDIVNMCKRNAVQVTIFPKISDILDGKITLNMIKDVKVEELLGRPPIELNLDGIAEYVTDKVVLVTGAGGSIGSEICRQVSNFHPQKLLILGHGENSIYTIEHEIKRVYPTIDCEAIIADIQDRKRMENIFAFHHPNVVFHAAAHKHVPLMEYNPTEAIKNNVFGTLNTAECSHLYGAEQFVLISTDKAVNPTSIMGVTKRIAEMIIQNLDTQSNTKFAAVRFGNVLGSRGSVIPLFKQQIQEEHRVTVTHPDMTRYFMTIPEAVKLVIQAGAFAKGGEIFILDMGTPVKISDLARDLITLSGLIPDKDIKIEYTGMRPGEKLYEELLTSEEGNMSSKHHLIFVAKPSTISQTDLSLSLDKLRQLLLLNETDQMENHIKTCLKQIVPTYQMKE